MPYTVPSNITNIPDKIKTLRSGTIQGLDTSNGSINALRNNLADVLTNSYIPIEGTLDSMIENADVGELIGDVTDLKLDVNGFVDFSVKEEQCTEVIEAAKKAANALKTLSFIEANGIPNLATEAWNAIAEELKSQAKSLLKQAYQEAEDKFFAEFGTVLGQVNELNTNFNTLVANSSMKPAVQNSINAQETQSPGSTGNVAADTLASKAKADKKKDLIKEKAAKIQTEKEEGSVILKTVKSNVNSLIDAAFESDISVAIGSIPGKATLIYENVSATYTELLTAVWSSVTDFDICKTITRLQSLIEYSEKLQAAGESLTNQMNELPGVSAETASKISKSAGQQMNTGTAASSIGGANIVQQSAQNIAKDIYDAQKFVRRQ